METHSKKSHAERHVKERGSIPAWLLIAPIRVYRYLLSPWVGHHCRFDPTCSDYAEQALRRFGLMRGSYLTARRLLKCHPWHSGGVDPIPEISTKQQTVNK